MEPTCQHHPQREAQARCVQCGSALCVDCRAKVEGRNYCRPCVPQSLRRRLPGRRSPAFAAVLSVLPGLGQFYAGSKFRGLVLGGSAFALAAHPHVVPDPLPLFLWVFNLFDAFLLARERNARVTGVALDPAERRQKRFFGLLAGAVALFTVARQTVVPSLEPDLLWPIALGLYGWFLFSDRKTPDVQHA